MPEEINRKGLDRGWISLVVGGKAIVTRQGIHDKPAVDVFEAQHKIPVPSGDEKTFSWGEVTPLQKKLERNDLVVLEVSNASGKPKVVAWCTALEFSSAIKKICPFATAFQGA
ncbi:MAG: hypothetical protein WC229_01850 [Candidatus Paceibacterota bacterium]|jgi:hypothetical protein